ncbi:MAG: hypothetical protein JNK48_19025 [Bryobacterales bacterium]|nr:hypothetical protein [Bryobacterales bacterium]
MSRWISLAYWCLMAGCWSAAYPAVIAGTGVEGEASAGVEAGLLPESGGLWLNGLWESIASHHETRLQGFAGITAYREVTNPTVDQSIVWALSLAEGPAQALALESMPSLDVPVPLLVDFRNLARRSAEGDVTQLPVAFLGQTPDLPTFWLFAPALGILLRKRRRRW